MRNHDCNPIVRINDFEFPLHCLQGLLDNTRKTAIFVIRVNSAFIYILSIDLLEFKAFFLYIVKFELNNKPKSIHSEGI